MARMTTAQIRTSLAGKASDAAIQRGDSAVRPEQRRGIVSAERLAAARSLTGYPEHPPQAQLQA